MYSGAWQVFSEAKKRVLSGEINLVSHLFRVALMSESWVPDLHAQSDWGQINSHELIVGGYDTGGVILAGKTLTRLDEHNKVTWDATITSIGQFDESAYVKYAVIYDDSHATDSLLCYCLIDANGSIVRGLKFDLLFDMGILNLI